MRSVLAGKTEGFVVIHVENTNCTWICPKCDFFNFSDSFFADQLNLENESRFDPLANGSHTCDKILMTMWEILISFQGD